MVITLFTSNIMITELVFLLPSFGFSSFFLILSISLSFLSLFYFAGIAEPMIEPLFLHFEPEKTAAKRCLTVGKGIWGSCTQNFPEEFSIIARDCFGNHRYFFLLTTRSIILSPFIQNILLFNIKL